MTRICQTCDFFVESAPYGRCHWQPVSVQKGANDWCGQYRQRPSLATQAAANAQLAARPTLTLPQQDKRKS